ncbi:hypothetical protein FQ707_04825 [Bacteroidaceae bacterium HV4-6-C5C]|nr:hypothetical protein FQ707_04825 [Bacteroidaceae bacterium HV4-6-C5C]
MLFYFKKVLKVSCKELPYVEVCPLSCEVTFKPLSTSLQSGIRFFYYPIPAFLSACLTAHFPK